MGKNTGKIKRRSQFSITCRRLVSSRTAVIGLLIIAIMIFVVIFGDLIAPYDPMEPSVMLAKQGPSLAHPFGTDHLGRDILSRVLVGAKYSLILGIIPVLIDTVLGTIIGSAVAYVGGWIDNVVMRIMDIINSIPSLLLCIVVSAALGPGFVNTIIAMCIGGIPKVARLARASVLGIRQMEYLEASESVNCSKVRMMFKHIIPNSLSPIIVHSTMGIGGHIQTVATLSFIGLGIQPPTPEWGAMLSDARTYVLNYPYMCFFPGLMIAIVVIAFNWVGDGLRDALDPKLKK
ncbi:MAG: ABC transporter permease [Lachnospiraceae bacterium]|nr:ABC transporter permease [Lachnospiraceae bacterium]